MSLQRSLIHMHTGMVRAAIHCTHSPWLSGHFLKASSLKANSFVLSPQQSNRRASLKPGLPGITSPTLSYNPPSLGPPGAYLQEALA